MFAKIIQKIKLNHSTAETRLAFFNHRTWQHINSVNTQGLKLIAHKKVDSKKLKAQLMVHDLSKFSLMEREPYIWLSWYFKCKREMKYFEYPEGIKEKVKLATYSHTKVNTHHVQAHEDVRDMSVEDLAEMVADWGAVSIEQGNDINSWANSFIPKHDFSGSQVCLIQEFISLLDLK